MDTGDAPRPVCTLTECLHSYCEDLSSGWVTRRASPFSLAEGNSCLVTKFLIG